LNCTHKNVLDLITDNIFIHIKKYHLGCKT